MIPPFPFSLMASIFLIFPVALTTPAPVFAATDGARNGAPSFDPADAQEKTLRQPTSRTETESQFTREDKAVLWGLSQQEWERYETLLEGIHGYRSDRLDPLTLLGIEARTAEERRQYAERLAKLEHDSTERLLAFQRAYDAAFERLYPDEPLIEAPGSEAAALPHRPGRPALYVSADDCVECEAEVQAMIDAGQPFDIFLVSAGTDEAIREWAQTLGIPAGRVRSGTITLNHARATPAEPLPVWVR